jgi:hypothetical protein
MEADRRKRFQIILGVLLLLVVLRTAYLFYQRHQASKPVQKQVTYSANLDDYVLPPKIYPFDLKSARKEMVGKTVWVKAGNQLPFYPYNSASKQAELNRQAGLLPPLQKLEIKEVSSQRIPKTLAEGQVAVVQHELMAIFAEPDHPGPYAVSIGTNTGEDFNFIVNDLFFFADPHELYKHWPADVWSAIEQHQAKAGMNELQVSFALGTAGDFGPGDYGTRTVEYTNNGNPVKVTFEKNKAVIVAPAAKQ